jgi:hypothetical protein
MVPVSEKKTHIMKHLGKTLVVLALLNYSGLTKAQTHNMSPGAARQEKVKDLSPEQRADRETQKMKEKLGLNEDQQQKWRQASVERHSANDPLRRKMQGSTTQEERASLKKQMRSNEDAFITKVMSFLNEDQKKKLEEHRNARREENQAHRKAQGKGHHSPAPAK